jgi:hypothetical protein
VLHDPSEHGTDGLVVVHHQRSRFFRRHGLLS